jgi:hypothetical protein
MFYLKRDVLFRHIRSKHNEAGVGLSSDGSGNSAGPGAPPRRGGGRRQRHNALPSAGQPLRNSASIVSDIPADVVGNNEVDYASVSLDLLPRNQHLNSLDNSSHASQTFHNPESAPVWALPTESPERPVDVTPISGDVLPGQSGDEMYSSIWDTQLFDLPWLNNFELSTAAISSIHATQPLWPLSIEYRSPAPSYSPAHETHPSREPSTIEEDLSRTLPNPKGRGNWGEVQRGRNPFMSLIDKVFSRRASPEPQKLRHISPVTRTRLPKMSGQTRGHLKTVIESFQHVISDDFQLPSQHALSRYISAYFEGFHLHLPFIHVPTWHPGSCQPGLVIAMCALGAKYCFEEEIAVSLWNVGTIIIGAATEKTRSGLDGGNMARIETCQALLLSMAFQTWAGNGSDLGKALSIQSTLASVSGRTFHRIGTIRLTQRLPCSWYGRMVCVAHHHQTSPLGRSGLSLKSARG